MIQRYAQKAYRSPLVRNASTLMIGSFFAQLIPLLFLPVLTRLYAPSLFAVQALLQTGGNFLMPLATGQYELAIPTPRNQRRAQALASIALVMGCALAAACLLAVLLLHEKLLAWFQITTVGDWAYSYPALALGLAVMMVSNYWLLRSGKFLLQSLNKMVMAFSTAILGIALGYMGVEFGLLIGFVGGLLIGAAWALWQAHGNGMALRLHESRDYYLQVARQYRQFPLFGAIPTSLSNLAAQIPLLIITAAYTLDVAGHYAVARNILFGGVQLLAMCAGQVVLKHIAERARARLPIGREYATILAGLAVFGLLLTAGVYVVGPWFFGLYLGAGWQESAEITRILSFTTLTWFVGLTAAQVAVAIQRMKVIAFWQVSYGAMACGLIFFSDRPFMEFLWGIVALEILAYTLYILLVSATVYRYGRTK